EEEAKRIVGDEELLSSMVEESISSVNDDSFNKSMLHTSSKCVEVNGASILVIVKNIHEMIPKSLCITRSGNDLFLKRITQRSKYSYLDEIMEFTPFGVSTSSVGFDMSFKTDTPNVNKRERTPRVVVMDFKVQFNRDLVRDAKGDEFIGMGGLSIIKWRGDLALGFNSLSQFSAGRNSKVAVRAGINNKMSRQITVKTSNSEYLVLALTAVIPSLISAYKKLWPDDVEKYDAY
nr:translocase of chloroplast 159, chloroplastic [Tanacetum cinerariifolium]